MLFQTGLQKQVAEAPDTKRVAVVNMIVNQTYLSLRVNPTAASIAIPASPLRGDPELVLESVRINDVLPGAGWHKWAPKMRRTECATYRTHGNAGNGGAVEVRSFHHNVANIRGLP